MIYSSQAEFFFYIENACIQTKNWNSWNKVKTSYIYIYIYGIANIFSFFFSWSMLVLYAKIFEKK